MFTSKPEIGFNCGGRGWGTTALSSGSGLRKCTAHCPQSKTIFSLLHSAHPLTSTEVSLNVKLSNTSHPSLELILGVFGTGRNQKPVFGGREQKKALKLGTASWKAGVNSYSSVIVRCVF